MKKGPGAFGFPTFLLFGAYPFTSRARAVPFRSMCRVTAHRNRSTFSASSGESSTTRSGILLGITGSGITRHFRGGMPLLLATSPVPSPPFFWQAAPASSWSERARAPTAHGIAVPAVGCPGLGRGKRRKASLEARKRASQSAGARAEGPNPVGLSIRAA